MKTFVTAVSMTIAAFGLAVAGTAAMDRLDAAPRPVLAPAVAPVPAPENPDWTTQAPVLFPNEDGSGQLEPRTYLEQLEAQPLLGQAPSGSATRDEGDETGSVAVTGWQDDPQPEPLPTRAAPVPVSHEDPAPAGVDCRVPQPIEEGAH